MFKKFLVAGAFALACPAFVFAQDINFLFGGGENLSGLGFATPIEQPVGTGTPASSTAAIAGMTGTTGTVNIFSTLGFQFDAADLDFFSSNPGVAQITGGTAFNGTFDLIGDDRFDSATVTADPGGASGNLFAVNVLNNGIVGPGVNVFDPFFDSTDGFLLASVDFALVGNGTTEFSFALGDLGIVQLPNVDVGTGATFGNATLSVEITDVPEPSSAILLILGSVAMVARRKRV